jgi:23S rRNA pseudouridine1911/1915/1917 synthase
MKDLGHSVVGDDKYGATTNPIKRLGLHAWVLSFTHPVTKEAMRFETEVPTLFLGLF